LINAEGEQKGEICPHFRSPAPSSINPWLVLSIIGPFPSKDDFRFLVFRAVFILAPHFFLPYTLKIKSLSNRHIPQRRAIPHEPIHADMGQWIREGKIKWSETIVEGIANAPKAFLGLFTGANFGKMLVRLGPDRVS